jgi:hypothetical protein
MAEEAEPIPTSDQSAPYADDSDNAEPDAIKRLRFAPMRRKFQIGNERIE